MKLLRCRNCGEYTREANFFVRVTVPCRLEPRHEKWWPHLEDSMELNGYPLERLDSDAQIIMDCPECDFYEKGTLEWVQVDECPHQWGKVRNNAARRKCELCGVEQQGKVKWD